MTWLKGRMILRCFLFLVGNSMMKTVDLLGGAICHPKDFCTCVMSDGSGTINLHPISSITNTPRFKDVPDADASALRKFVYDFNPCKTFTMGNCQDVLLCQVNKLPTSPLYYDIGSTMSTKYDTSKKQLTFVYPSSHKSLTQKITYIDLVCDEKAENPVLSSFRESPADTYYSTLTTKYACLKKVQGRKKISVGTILCILLLITLVLYISLGIIFNKYQRQKEGAELIPNVEFWKDLPSLVKDGCLFSWTKVRGRPSEYQQI